MAAKRSSGFHEFLSRLADKGSEKSFESSTNRIKVVLEQHEHDQGAQKTMRGHANPGFLRRRVPLVDLTQRAGHGNGASRPAAAGIVEGAVTRLPAAACWLAG
jgi:hypothetical protein